MSENSAIHFGILDQHFMSENSVFHHFGNSSDAENSERTETTQDISVNKRIHCVDDMMAGLGL